MCPFTDGKDALSQNERRYLALRSYGSVISRPGDWQMPLDNSRAWGELRRVQTDRAKTNRLKKEDRRFKGQSRESWSADNSKKGENAMFMERFHNRRSDFFDKKRYSK